MDRKRLPIGIQTFATIRGGDYYYVDKTGYAMQVAEYRTCFLSRPRRFGKSLFLDTLAEMFAGNKALFEGLACYDVWDWGTVYPVVRLSFAGGKLREPDALDERIVAQLQRNAVRLGLGPMPQYRIPDLFIWLIQEAEQVHGQQVVVLVDEYDKPIVDNLSDTAVAEEMRSGLQNLYSVLKDQEAHLRFVMLTGVSQFSKVSVFSDLNNLRNISMDQRFSAVCGYTEDDLDEVFAPELEGLDRDQVREWYNGYNWLGTAVYNPYDLLLLFDQRVFKAHWFETGTPGFLVQTLKSRRFFVPDLARSYASAELLSRFDIRALPVEALLFQTGYLTITGTEVVGGRTYHTLGYPNREVRDAANSTLLEWLIDDPPGAERHQRRLRLLLEAGDLEALGSFFTALYDGIAHEWYTNNDIAGYEGFYASVFYACIAGSGLDPVPEESSNAGRLDLAVRVGAQVYLFEFKVVDDEPEGKALAQIKDRGYADKHLGDGVPVHLVGVEFSRNRRTVVGFETETINPR
ncbi:MAG: ATP-binding protein [Micrococcales bacterium]|nr:ATP-binding protein [Micrococcales bacterium]